MKFVFFHKGLTEEYTTTNLFLLLLVMVCLPKILFTLLSLIPKIGTYIGIALALCLVFVALWGITFGFSKLEVKEIVYESKDLPEAFDGYKIVQFSDAHTGVFRGPYKHLLRESIDKINEQNADIICFVGDIENFTPQELDDHKETYSALRAKDGVYSIMGNHDYSSYLKLTPRKTAELVSKTRSLQRSFGWDLLENENRTIYRTTKAGNRDSLVIVGEENWGKRPFPQLGNLHMALKGVDVKKAFTIMLSHDPTAWKAHILPVFRPAITLSGHTHGTQFSIFGWSPASKVYKEWGGEYYEKECMLSVSTGMGGNFPFRFNMPREIVVITLKRKY